MTDAQASFLAFAGAFAERELAALEGTGARVGHAYAAGVVAEIHAIHGEPRDAIRWVDRIPDVGVRLSALGTCVRARVERARDPACASLLAHAERLFKNRRQAGDEGSYGIIKALAWTGHAARATRLQHRLDRSSWRFNARRELRLASLFLSAADLDATWRAIDEDEERLRQDLRAAVIFASVAWGRAAAVRAWAESLTPEARGGIDQLVARASEWHAPVELDDAVRALRAREGRLANSPDAFHEAFELLGRAARGFRR